MTASDYIVGYGSLLSAYSRETFSGLHDPVIPVIAKGWRRGWTVRFFDERATYCGVRAVADARLVAALVPAVISAELRHRERGYVFTELDRSTLHTVSGDFAALPDARFWIVVNRHQSRANTQYPIAQSYIDTCLLGCLETGGETMAQSFIEDTELWDGYWLNDRDCEPRIYPRQAPLTNRNIDRVDSLLEQAGLLRHRTG